MDYDECSDLTTSVTIPSEYVCAKEFEEDVLKAGSVISILENKKLNPINLFLCLLESKQYQDLFVEITSMSNFKEAISHLLYLYPSLVKSKITKSAIKHAQRGHNNRLRKAPLQ
jgi:hypothetical protein